MNSVLRMALAYFVFVPLQKWLNVAAAIVLAVGIFLVFFMTEANARTGGSVFVILIAILIGITPVFGGGIAMRLASTRTLLHLRPQGRLRLLLASTLTITALATLFALAVWFVSIDKVETPKRPLSVLMAFEIAWAGVAAAWIGMFILSRSMMVFAFMGLFPIIGNYLIRLFMRIVPDPVWLLVIAIFAWLIFCAWYLRTRSVHRPYLPAFSMSSTGFEGSPVQRVLLNMGGSKGERTRTQTQFEYLFGCASPLFYVAIGVWIALIFLFVNAVAAPSKVRGAAPLIAMLPFFSFFHASLGFTTARRARFLWLRAGLDRPALFRLSERWGQRSAFSAWGVVAATIIVYSLVRGDAISSDLLLFIAAQASIGAALFYAGVGSVRGWTWDEVIISVFIGVAFVMQGVILVPFHPIESSTYFVAIAITALVAALLRWRALHWWRRLDWRTAKVSRMSMGG